MHVSADYNISQNESLRPTPTAKQTLRCGESRMERESGIQLVFPFLEERPSKRKYFFEGDCDRGGWVRTRLGLHSKAYILRSKARFRSSRPWSSLKGKSLYSRNHFFRWYNNRSDSRQGWRRMCARLCSYFFVHLLCEWPDFQVYIKYETT